MKPLLPGLEYGMNSRTSYDRHIIIAPSCLRADKQLLGIRQSGPTRRAKSRRHLRCRKLG